MFASSIYLNALPVPMLNQVVDWFLRGSILEAMLDLNMRPC